MKCEQCDEAARVHVTEKVEGKLTTRHYCERCAPPVEDGRKQNVSASKMRHPGVGRALLRSARRRRRVAPLRQRIAA